MSPCRWSRDYLKYLGSDDEHILLYKQAPFVLNLNILNNKSEIALRATALCSPLFYHLLACDPVAVTNLCQLDIFHCS
jgi:hypothetical protein